MSAPNHLNHKQKEIELHVSSIQPAILKTVKKTDSRNPGNASRITFDNKYFRRNWFLINIFRGPAPASQESKDFLAQDTPGERG